MDTMTTEIYEQQQAACNDLCIVPATKLQEQTGELPCVRCPFCKEIVTAILTKTSIACPACKVSVGR